MIYQRALGFDKRVLDINYEIDWNCMQPAPHFASKAIRMVIEVIRLVVANVKLLVRRLKYNRLGGEEVAVQGKTRSVAEKAMDEFRRKLEHTFGSSERVVDLMRHVEYYTNVK